VLPFWAITLKGDDTLRGRIDLWAYDPERRDSRGFWLDPELWGQGLMTEAADAVTDYALATFGWPHLYLTNATANRRSARVKSRWGRWRRRSATRSTMRSACGFATSR
jgi:RimJ/RimL family protein N-acetyltransferase